MRKALNTVFAGSLVLILGTGAFMACNNGTGDTDSTDTTGTEYGEDAYNEGGGDMNRSATNGGTINNNNTNARAGSDNNTGGTQGTDEVNNGSFPADAGSTGAGNGRPPEDSATRNLKKHGTIQENY